MRLKDLVGKMAIRTAEPFSIVPPSGVVGFGLHGEPMVFRFNQKYMDEPVKKEVIWKITILLWISYLIAVRIVRYTMSREEKNRARILGKVRITPFRVLTCLLFFASLIMTIATAIWFLFFYLK